MRILDSGLKDPEVKKNLQSLLGNAKSKLQSEATKQQIKDEVLQSIFTIFAIKNTNVFIYQRQYTRTRNQAKAICCLYKSFCNSGSTGIELNTLLKMIKNYNADNNKKKAPEKKAILQKIKKQLKAQEPKQVALNSEMFDLSLGRIYFLEYYTKDSSYCRRVSDEELQQVFNGICYHSTYQRACQCNVFERQRPSFFDKDPFFCKPSDIFFRTRIPEKCMHGWEHQHNWYINQLINMLDSRDIDSQSKRYIEQLISLIKHDQFMGDLLRCLINRLFGPNRVYNYTMDLLDDDKIPSDLDRSGDLLNYFPDFSYKASYSVRGLDFLCDQDKDERLANYSHFSGPGGPKRVRLRQKLFWDIARELRTDGIETKEISGKKYIYMSKPVNAESIIKKIFNMATIFFVGAFDLKCYFSHVYMVQCAIYSDKLFKCYETPYNPNLDNKYKQIDTRIKKHTITSNSEEVEKTIVNIVSMIRKDLSWLSDAELDENDRRWKIWYSETVRKIRLSSQQAPELFKEALQLIQESDFDKLNETALADDRINRGHNEYDEVNYVLGIYLQRLLRKYSCK